MHDPANRGDQITRVVEPAVGIVDAAAFLVTGDSVAVDEPLQRRASVDLLRVRRSRNAAQPDEIVDDEARLFVAGVFYRPLADAVMFRFRFSRLRDLDAQGICLAGLVAEMKFREGTPGTGEVMEIRRKGNTRQVVGEALAVIGRVEDAVDVIEKIVLGNCGVAIADLEGTQGGVGDVVDALQILCVIESP